MCYFRNMIPLGIILSFVLGVVLCAPWLISERGTRTVPLVLQAASLQRNMSLADNFRKQFLSRTWVAGEKIQTMKLH